jgi:DNA-directed RNA polymerase subunit RPC12/RpoP
VADPLSDDEAARRLERERRYEKGLADLLTCLREGHDPEDYRFTRNAMGGLLQPCKRCGLVYFRAPGTFTRPTQAAEASIVDTFRRSGGRVYDCPRCGPEPGLTLLHGALCPKCGTRLVERPRIPPGTSGFF